MVGLGRLELPTSRLSGVRSSQLSYRPFGSKTARGRSSQLNSELGVFSIKEVIQPQVPLRLPCYDFTPITSPTVGGCLPKVSSPMSGRTSFRGVTGGVYKARERIHPGMLIRDY